MNCPVDRFCIAQKWGDIAGIVLTFVGIVTRQLEDSGIGLKSLIIGIIKNLPGGDRIG